MPIEVDIALACALLVITSVALCVITLGLIRNTLNKEI